MKKLNKLFEKKNILSIYFTAGYPNLNDTRTIIKELANNDVDMIEIGIPFSDPLADGPVIQASSKLAIENGMNLNLLFDQLHGIRNEAGIPLVMMGYFNSVLQFGVEEFCKKCNEVEIDAVIIPDLPLDEFNHYYKNLFEKYNLDNVLLATPSTSIERLKTIDDNSKGFVYFVSSNSTTGNKNGVEDENNLTKINEFEKPVLIGFGIKDKASFKNACRHAHGAIIGTAFINAITHSKDLKESIREFISSIKN